MALPLPVHLTVPAARMSTDQPTRLPWDEIDAVLLDLDGTLLDLHFDNHFFLEHLPRRMAEQRGITSDAARAELVTRYRAVEGRLEWYCLDYWQRELALDLVALKQEIADRVRWRRHAPGFLSALHAAGYRRVLATNAHPDTLAFKRQRVPFPHHLDAGYSAHELGAPKEQPEFWDRLVARERFDPARTLFIDDNARVLAAARDWGIGHVLGISRPDSSRPPNELQGFVAVEDFDRVNRPGGRAGE